METHALTKNTWLARHSLSQELRASEGKEDAQWSQTKP